jgi:hypothetical protein
MATEKIGFDITVNGVERTITSFKDLKKATKDLRDEQLVMSQKFGDTSVEATNAGKKIAELQDKIDDLNDSSKSLKGTGFEMLKQGFGQVREGLMNLDFDKVKTGLTAMSSGFVSMGKAAMTSLQGIKGAIAATGIGLLVIALGTIYAYWDDIKGVVDGLTPELKKQNEIASQNLKTQEDKLNAISGQENILKLQGKTEKEILQIKMKQTDEAIAASDIAIAQAEETKKAQVEASQRNKNILQGIIAFVTAPISILLQGIDAIGSAFGKNFGLFEGFTGGIAKMVFDPDEVAAEGDKAIEAAKAVNAKLKNDRAGLQLSINAIDKKSVEDNKKTNEDKVQNSKEAADKQVDHQVELQGKLKELQTQLIADEQEKEQTILKNKFLADQQDLYNKGANAELLKALNDNFEKDKLEISDKYLKIKQDKEAEAEAKRQSDADKAIAIIEADEKKKIALQLSNLESGYQLELEQIENNDLLKLQKEQELLDQVYQINIENTELLGTNKLDIDNKYAKDKIALEKKIAAETKKIKQDEISKGLENVKNALQTGQNLSDLYFSIKSAKAKKGSKEEMDLAKQQFEMNKKFNLAMALINGVQSVLAITTVPDFTLGVASAIRIAASITATAAGIAKIASSQFEGGGGGSVPDTSTSIPSAPTTSQAPSIYGPGQGQSTTFSGNQNNNFAPVKAYVVETENRSTTNRVNKLVSESTYG